MRVAYRVTTGDGNGDAEVHVVVARDLVEAATYLRDQMKLGGEVQTIELLGPAVVVASQPAPEAQPSKKRAVPAVARPPKNPRRVQLETLLRDHGTAMHVSEVAEAFNTNVGNASNIITDAIRHGLVRRVGNRTGRVELVGGDDRPAGAEAAKASPPDATSATTPKPKRKKKRRGPSHADRLVELLGQRDEPVHLDELVTHLDTTRGTVQEVIRAAAKAGRVRRVGSKTGMVALAEVGKPEASEDNTTTPAKRREPTRARQVLQVLRRRGGHATASHIATSLGTDDKKAKTAIDQAVQRRWVRHLDDGRIGLMPAMMAGLEKPPDDAPKLSEVQKRVFNVLQDFRTPATAKEIAVKLGVRPREAGNAVAVLVEKALAERVGGGDTPRYLPAG